MTNERIKKAVAKAIKETGADWSPEVVLASKIVEAVMIDLFGENAGKKE